MPSKWMRLASSAVVCLAGCGAPNAPDPADCPTTTLEPSGPWARTYGGPQADKASAIAATPPGDLLVAGSTRSFGAVGEEAWALKVARGGEVLWSERFAALDALDAITGTADGGAIVAAGTSVSVAFGRNSALLLARLDCAGDELWAKTFEIPEGIAFVEAVRATADGGFLVAGTVATAAPGTDCLAFKVSGEGTLAWQRAYGRAGEDEHCYSIAPLPGGGAILAGDYEAGPRRDDLWLVRVDASGAVEWQRTYGVAPETGPRAFVREVGDGTFVATAPGGDGLDVLAVDGTGATVWRRSYAFGRNRVLPDGVAVSADGALTIAGTMGPDDDDREDVFALRVSASGDPAWSRRYRRETTDRAVGVVGLADGRSVLGGTLAWGSPEDADDVLLALLGPGRADGFGDDAPVTATRKTVAPIDTEASSSVPRIDVAGARLRATKTSPAVRPAP